MRVMYPGSFDPITYGHIDLIERSSKKFDELVVAVMGNDSKHVLFSLEERLEMIKESVKHLPNVEVRAGSGLTIDFARNMNCTLLIRGIRAVMDYEYELQSANINRVLDTSIETLFLVASPHFSYISSSVAKTLAYYQGDLHEFVPEHVAEKLMQKYHPKP